MMSRQDSRRLAARFAILRPQSGEPARVLWARMVTAATATVVREQDVRDFRDSAGWRSDIDRGMS